MIFLNIGQFPPFQQDFPNGFDAETEIFILFGDRKPEIRFCDCFYRNMQQFCQKVQIGGIGLCEISCKFFYNIIVIDVHGFLILWQKEFFQLIQPGAGGSFFPFITMRDPLSQASNQCQKVINLSIRFFNFFSSILIEKGFSKIPDSFVIYESKKIIPLLSYSLNQI